MCDTIAIRCQSVVIRYPANVGSVGSVHDDNQNFLLLLFSVRLALNAEDVLSPFVDIVSIARGRLRRSVSNTRAVIVNYDLGARYDRFAAGRVGRRGLAARRFGGGIVRGHDDGCWRWFV